MLSATDYLQKRQDAGLSQSATARLTGYSRTQVIRVETGTSRGSAAYEAAFLAAVEQGEPEVARALTRPPSARSRKALENGKFRMELASEALGRMREIITSAIHANDTATVHMGFLVGEGTGIDTEHFDPTLASDEDIQQVSKYVVNVLAELMIDHRFHLCDADIINRYLEIWSQEASRLVRLHRNRKVGL